MGILRIYLEGQLLIKCYVKKHLILLKIHNMADMSEDVHQWFTNFLIKSATHKKGELILKTNN